MDLSAMDAAMSALQLGPQIGAAMLSKVLESSQQSAASLIGDLSALPPPAGVGEIGGLLDAVA